MNNTIKTDVLIAGCGCSGLYMAMNLPADKKILMITKSDCESSDSFLAQGGMCMLKCEEDYDSYFEDTMKAGHYENDKKSVEIMIRSSADVVKDLVDCGARFAREADGSLAYTREGAHSSNRIIFHEDITGKEITSHLLEKVRTLPNVTIMEYTRLLDIISRDNRCLGAVIRTENGELIKVEASDVVLATGGIGGLYRHSTNFRHLTGEEDRSLLISESVRGEGAKLYDKNGKRFVNELLPRDLLTEEIRKQMAKDNTDFVWEDLRTIPEEELKTHFPNIVQYCIDKGYDPSKECIPVVPAQHYFMGGIKVDHESRTTMDNLYAIGETACNGVHGRNRLASNSLLESLVFAKRAALDITENAVVKPTQDEITYFDTFDAEKYADESKIDGEYAELVNKKIEEADKAYEESQKKNYA